MATASDHPELRLVAKRQDGDLHKLTPEIIHDMYLPQQRWLPLLLGILLTGPLVTNAQAASGSVAVVWGGTSYGKTNIPPAATNLIALVAGGDHTLALRADGAVVAWGLNSVGQTNSPTTASNIVEVSAGAAHNLAWRADGALLAWGYNAYGMTNIPPAATNQPLAAIAAGASHNLVLRTNGTVFAWGNPGFGITNIPARAANGRRIAAGRFGSAGHNLLLRRDGTVVGWGSGGTSATNPPAAATNLVAVAAGGNFSLGLKADGTVIGWGDNASGQITVPAAATNVVAIAGGANHTLALRADGSIVGWGSNSNGKRNIPALVSNLITIAITAGTEHSGCLLGDGKPGFTDSLGELVAYRNRVFTLNVLAVGAPPLRYQWQFNGVDIPNATNGTFTLPSVQSTNAGRYAVVVTNSLGVISGLVADVSVEIAPESPSVIEPPQSQTVFAGTNVTFNVQAGGNPAPSYQWQYNNTNLVGATNSSYLIPYVFTNQAGNYRVVLSNSVGVVTSTVATLTVTLPDWPTLNSWPAPRAVSYGSPLTLSVVPTPSAGPVAYTWQLNGTNLPHVGGPTLVFSSFNITEGGVYRVAVSNQYGGSASPEFEIAAVPVAAWGSGVVTNLPRSLTNAIALGVGAQHGLALKADGQVTAWGDNLVITGISPPYTTNNYGMATAPAGLSNVVAIAAGTYHNVAVRSDGMVVAWGRHTVGQTNTPAAATNVIAVAAGDAHSLALRADGTLIAWGTNNTGQINIPADATNILAIAAGSSHSVAVRDDGRVLVWGTPNTAVTTIPASATNIAAISARASYTIAVRADGTKVLWGNSLPTSTPFSVPGSAFYSTADHVSAAAGFQHGLYLHANGAIQALYSPGLFGSDARLLPPTWLANVVGVAAGNASFALLRPPGGLPVKQVAQRQTFVGSPAVFSAHVEGQRALGLPSAGGYQWRFNGGNLPGQTNRFLVLPAATFAQAGDYLVVATDTSGSVTSQVANLVVTAPPLPQIVSPPVSQTNGAGSTVTFSVALAYGIPGQFQWQFNETDLPGANGASLSLANIQLATAGNYRVVVTNFSGSVTSGVAMLVVTSTPPAVLSPPQDLAVAAGLPALFSVKAAGTDPLCYQWRLNEVDLNGATNDTLLVPGVSESDVGFYRVVITNSAGTVTSSPAWLAISPVAVWGTNDSLARMLPATATNLLALAVGDTHALALRADGTVIGWGGNSCGQATIPADATNVVRVAAAALRSLALRDDGTVLAWGQTSAGLNTVPAGLFNVVEIAAGTLHNLALRGDGTVAAWGVDWGGNPLTPPATATNVIAIAAGGSHSLALRADGTVVGWGNNAMGQVNIPPSATNLIAIAAGFNFSAGLRADGQVIVWGLLAASPRLTATYSCGGHSLSTSGAPTDYGPVAMPAEATNLVALAAGRHHLLLLRADGALIPMGDASAGQDAIPPIANVIGITASGFQSVALVGDAAPRLGGFQTIRTSGVGTPLVLNVATAGFPPLGGWQWKLFSTNAPVGTRPHLFLPTPLATDAGNYEFTVTNPFGTATGMIYLTLTSMPPRLVIQPLPQSTNAGANVTFNVSAAGTLPLTYQWQRDGSNLVESPLVSGATASNLRLLNVQASDAGTYRVAVSNELGGVVSSNATLVVFTTTRLETALDTEGWNWTNGGPSPAQWQTATTHDGVDAAQIGPCTTNQTNWIETTVSGPGAVNFWWRAFGWVTDRFSFLIDGVEQLGVANDFEWQPRSYSLPEGLHTLRWSYACEPFAGASTAWLDQVTLTAPIAPSMATHPTSRSAIVGANTTFSSVASGTEPFSYQWRFNGVDLPAATNSKLTISSVQPGNAGSYQIVVTNLVGAVTSQVAVLTVNGSLPIIQSGPSSLTAAPGTAPILQSTIIGSTPLEVQWQWARVDLPAATNSNLVFPNLQPEQAGLYRVIGSNQLGTAISAEARLTIVPVAAWGSSLFSPTRVPADVGDVIGVAGGLNHSAALRRDGSVATWGSYSVSANFNALTPGNPLSAIAGAANHDIGLRPDGTVVVFGDLNGGLGEVPSDLTNVIAVATSGRHDLALRNDGTVATWGTNALNLLTVPADASNLVAIAAGGGVSLGVRDTGELTGWGDNSAGLLTLPPGTDFVAVAAGIRHALALRADGTVIAWGTNDFGQTAVPAGLSNVVALVAGDYHNLALRGDGKVFAWGRNNLGQTTVWDTLTNVTAVAGGNAHSLALVGDGHPVITIPPQRRRLQPGGSTVLQVFATGAGPLAYLWQHEGTNIPGATNATLLVGMGGNYTVTISNGLGSVISPPAQLIAIPPAPALRFLSPSWTQTPTGTLFRAILTGLAGNGPITIFGSTNLSEWSAVTTNAPVSGDWPFSHLQSNGPSLFWYRAEETR